METSHFEIKNIDNYRFEFCECFDIDMDEEDDILSFFDGNPDFTKIDGETSSYFILHEKTNCLYYYPVHSEKETEQLLRKFLDNNLNRVDPNTWETFERVDNGVAFRNYSGYYYTLYEIL